MKPGAGNMNPALVYLGDMFFWRGFVFQVRTLQKIEARFRKSRVHFE